MYTNKRTEATAIETDAMVTYRATLLELELELVPFTSDSVVCENKISVGQAPNIS
jgi:hypothetical protein